MTDKLSTAQGILLRRIAETGDEPFEIAPRARATAVILARRGLLTGESDLWSLTQEGRTAIGLTPQPVPPGDSQAPDVSVEASPPVSGRVPKPGTKAATVIEMLGRPDGVTVAQISDATAWLPHSVRGFMAGALKKTHGLAATSEAGEGGRLYRLTGAAS
ncbi:DUF3489 domain-containing protein [Brevundimonas subvibrioides]|uniref:DUF3489 domain-containing protein n=1 Tax=Brevundimonas subvibrioides TaxID=74313 RepID=UPI0022B54A75|nr:DUF3489 domain-containing protein [Brevundimonas subvibrioides]